MTICVTDEGQIVLPDFVARQLGARSGDMISVQVEDGRAVLTAAPSVIPRKARIVKDPITGLPVLTFGPDSPVMTSQWVEEMLADFP